jgi:hypothetical protein
MKAVAVALTALVLASCATIQHPSSPGVQYRSMEQCWDQHLQDTPLDCQKVMHQAATEAAVGIGATLFVVLVYLGLIALIVAGGR